ncbi:hypothetical protein CDN99_24035 [Roseateles aquatilis]|uniref:DUF4124 domain-containing protein n=1 Tax=Roseateles aquatilis TaxID=431061 RepID=A0A246IVW2_9BURK|nr:DUF4124 domain-containing protein [Roseateles aquatilis]OWQ84368.1 hypothetical protein CDN99_24035 [Roseateles aquatilis]
MRLLIPLGLLLAAAGVQAQVWKCEVNGKTVYSDRKCEAKGEALNPAALQANSLDASADRAAIARSKDEAAAAAAQSQMERMQQAGAGPAASQNVCPTDRDIAGMETRASSISLSREAKSFMQDEIRRARQCQKGQGRYTAADWKISRDAQDAQSSLSGGADARRRAESMHSAADPSEGDRISRSADRRESRAAYCADLRARGRECPAER